MREMWRDLARALPHATRINPDAYAVELDAVDDALRRAESWEPTPLDERSLGVFETGDGPPVEIIAREAPLPSVRGDDPARVAVAVLQRLAWNTAATWTGAGNDAPPGGYGTDRFAKLYWMARILLRRRLRPTATVATDLIGFAVAAPPTPGRPPSAGDFLYPVLKVIERQFTPPTPRSLRPALRSLSDTLVGIREEALAGQRRYRQKPQTKRLDQALDRVRRLLG